jgi:hypothetical protein
MRPASAILVALLLAACGTNDTDRVQGGAATGAATGAAIGIIGGPIGVVVGGVIGGGAGAITAASTSPEQLNLGKPVWDNPEIRTPVTN